MAAGEEGGGGGRDRSNPRLISALDWGSRDVSSGNNRCGRACGSSRGWGDNWRRRGC